MRSFGGQFSVILLLSAGLAFGEENPTLLQVENLLAQAGHFDNGTISSVVHFEHNMWVEFSGASVTDAEHNPGCFTIEPIGAMPVAVWINQGQPAITLITRGTEWQSIPCTVGQLANGAEFTMLVYYYGEQSLDRATSAMGIVAKACVLAFGNSEQN